MINSRKHLRFLIIAASLCFLVSILSPHWIEASSNSLARAQHSAQAGAAQRNDLKSINALYNRAYDLFEQDPPRSRRMLKDAAHRLTLWIRKYENDPSKLSFLLMQARLGLYLE